MRRLLIVLSLAACAARTPAPKLAIARDAGEQHAHSVTLTQQPTTMPTPVDGLGGNLADAFGGYNLLYYAGAIGATGALAASGVDHRIHVEVSRNNERRSWNKTASVAGYVAPTATPMALWLVGLATRDRGVAGAGAAAIQAVVIAMSTTGALKLVTGRPRPVVDESIDDSDRPKTFEPFARISGWPSGHATGAFSLAAVLTAYAPDKRWIPAIGYPLALAIGIGMVDLDGHWTSDVVAGALIGQAIGYTVGRNFRHRIRGKRRHELGLAPAPGGLSFYGRW